MRGLGFVVFAFGFKIWGFRVLGYRYWGSVLVGFKVDRVYREGLSGCIVTVIGFGDVV